MQKYASVASLCIVFLLTAILTVPRAGFAAGQPWSASYFSSGQAAFNPQDPAKSQQEAIKDLMVQGVTQAIGSFLSPPQIGEKFTELQNKVLSRPEKYVASYQVFSEKQVGQLFRVVGQVTVSMDPLKEDLVKSGILAAQQQPQAPTATSTGAPAAATESENAQSAQRPGEPQTSAPLPPPSQPQTVEQAAGGTVSAAPSAAKKQVLWAVAENWKQGWVLPAGGGDVRPLFAQSVAREMGDFGFSILLPQAGSVRMAPSGDISASQAVSLAQGLGVQDVVVGKVSSTETPDTGQVWLDADLQVIRIDQGKSEFELHKALSMQGLSNQAGALGLARQIAPQLSSLLGGPAVGIPRGGAEGQGNAGVSPQGPQMPSEQVGTLGPLLINVPSSQYPYWMELESILRRQFRNMQITGIEIGPTESSAKLDGVSGEYISKMSGTLLPSGATVRVDSYSSGAQAMKLSFVPPGKVQAETK